MSLDGFFGTKPPPPEIRCSNPACHMKLGKIKWELTEKEVNKLYCKDCYLAKLQKLRPTEENSESKEN